ncbi:MAG TPA: hypothetical protein PLW77_03755 [Bacteroidales bacterium]|nr:hypothetical protein [Bacteroidales bacterium]HQB21374.1 hypothetical protein [Bacteroidales bacterium]
MIKKVNKSSSKIIVGSVLTRHEIESLGIIVFDNKKDVDPECFDETSYNLRLGEEYYKPKVNQEDTNREYATVKEYPACPYKKGKLIGVEDCNLNNRVLVIKPYTTVIISTLERLNLPNCVVGRFDLKIRWALQGLILQVGTQIAPGYKGRLFGLLHNLSNKDICIPMGLGILDVEFSYITKPVEPKIYDESYNTIEGFLKDRPPIVGTLEAFLEEIKKEKQEMTKIGKELKEDRNNYQNKKIQFWSVFAGIVIAILIGIVTIVVPIAITKITVDKDDYPFQKVYEMETKNKEMYLKIDSLLNKNKQISDSLIILGRKINDIEKKNGKNN